MTVPASAGRIIVPTPEYMHGSGSFQQICALEVTKSSSGLLQVSCGGAHTVVVSRQEGTVWAWGHGTSGQTGHGHADLVSLPKVVDALVHQHIDQASMRCHMSTLSA